MACTSNLFLTIAMIYIISDLVSLLSVYTFFAEDKLQLWDEVHRFTFKSSVLDFILFAVFRFVFLISALIAPCNPHTKNNVQMMWRTTSMYYGCVQAIYIVLKIVVYNEKDYNDSKRFWLMIGITLLSCLCFRQCYKVLNKYAITRTTKTKFDTYADGVNGNASSVSDNDSSCTKEEADHWEINSNDKLEADKLAHGKIIRELLKIAKPDFIYFITALTFLFVCAVCQTIIPYYTGMIVNYIVVERNVQKFNSALFSLTMIVVASVISAGLRGGCYRYVLGRYKLRLQHTLFSSLVRMEIGFFDIHNTGELSARLTTDCRKVSAGIGYNSNIFLRNIVRIMGIIFFMFKLSWRLSMVVMVTLPVITIISDYFGVKSEALTEKVQNSLAYANSCATETLSSMQTVRAFAAEEYESDRYHNLLETTRSLMKQKSIVTACYRWAVEFTNLVMTLLILYYGGHLVMKDELSGNHFLSFILYSFDLTRSIQSVSDVYTGLMDVIGASKNLFVYITRQPVVQTNGDLKPAAGIQGNIEFKNVSFEYPSRENTTVLKNLNFTAKQGEVVALVGPSGAGKSSVMNLLQHFYEAEHGEVLIDGVEVKQYDHHFIHQQMSFVQQEPTLFARSLAENITYGLQDGRDTSQTSIEHAATLANAHTFITSMPNKYATQAGEQGVQLSGGQKQRVAIARALIRKPTILLLDEATSALDTESEHLVQQAINKNITGRTVIVIAHRLSTVEKADKILVMEKGEVVETGRHQQLVDRGGVYAALVSNQLLGVNEDVDRGDMCTDNRMFVDDTVVDGGVVNELRERKVVQR